MKLAVLLEKVEVEDLSLQKILVDKNINKILGFSVPKTLSIKESKHLALPCYPRKEIDPTVDESEQNRHPWAYVIMSCSEYQEAWRRVIEKVEIASDDKKKKSISLSMTSKWKNSKHSDSEKSQFYKAALGQFMREVADVDSKETADIIIEKLKMFAVLTKVQEIPRLEHGAFFDDMSGVLNQTTAKYVDARATIKAGIKAAKSSANLRKMFEKGTDAVLEMINGAWDAILKRLPSFK
jgi:hypothetical protein